MSWKDKKFVKAHVLKQNRNDPKKIVTFHTMVGYKTLDDINGALKLERTNYIYFEHNNNCIKHLFSNSKYFSMYWHSKKYCDMIRKVNLVLNSIK